MDPIRQTGTVLIGDAALRRLAELGIDPVRLERALDAGETAAAAADEFHPVTAAGAYRWYATVAELRRGLAEDGWEAREERNSPRAVNAAEHIGLVPISGDWRTGRAHDGDPQTARAKGAATARSVQINVQLEFDLSAWLPDMGGEHSDTIETWVLLYRRSTDPDEVHAEVSLPVEMNDRGHVTKWRERIVLPPRPMGVEVHARTPRDAKPGDDVDFTIAAH